MFLILSDATSANQFQLKLLKYATDQTDTDPQASAADDTYTDAYTDADSDGESSTKPASRSLGEITLDDLPSKMNAALSRIEASTKEINIGTEILDKIIMEAIPDGFVGDGYSLPELDEDTQKSESSTSSDNFVMVSSGNSSDQVMVDSPPKKDSPEHVTILSNDTTITEMSPTFV